MLLSFIFFFRTEMMPVEIFTSKLHNFQMMPHYSTLNWKLAHAPTTYEPEFVTLKYKPDKNHAVVIYFMPGLITQE